MTDRLVKPCMIKLFTQKTQCSAMRWSTWNNSDNYRYLNEILNWMTLLQQQTTQWTRQTDTRYYVTFNCSNMYCHNVNIVLYKTCKEKILKGRVDCYSALSNSHTHTDLTMNSIYFDKMFPYKNRIELTIIQFFTNCFFFFKREQ